jgi:glycosyltransferase involved in cell wall biosynthesis
MKIVVVMVEPPLPFGNAAARWYFVLLKQLKARGHEVVAFVSSSNPQETEAARQLFPKPDYDLRIFPVAPPGGGLLAKFRSFKRPYSFLFTKEFVESFEQELAKGFDVLHLEHLWSGWLALKHVERAVLHIHYLFSIDLAGPTGKRMMSPLLYARTMRSERKILRAYPNITTLSPRLAEAIHAISPRSKVDIVPLGIDPSLYPFDASVARDSSVPPTLGLIGSFRWQPSFLAAERLLTRLWPAIHARVPTARLQIIGRGASAALTVFKDTPGLEIHSDVIDPIPYFQALDVLLYAPIQGSGMKVKILEAFALGTPVVTNTEGVEGLNATDGVHAGIAEDDEGLIQRAVQLLLDPAKRQAQRIAARQLIEAENSPIPTVDALESILQSLAREK